MKFKHGWLRNLDGEEKEVIVKSALPLRVRDLIIGGLMTISGIVYMLWSSFKKGSYEHEVAEYETMCELGIIKDQPESN